MNGNGSYHMIRAIRGPITLITLGVLFALQNFTRFGFDQTWPVLLIVFGLMSLLGRVAAPPAPPAPPPYWQPPAWQPPPAGQQAPGGYRATPYAQGPEAQAGSTAPPGPGSPEGSTPGGGV